MLQSTLVFLTVEDFMKYVPGSAGDLGSEMETNTKTVTKCNSCSHGSNIISISPRLIIISDH